MIALWRKRAGCHKRMEGERHDLKKEMANSFSEATYNLKNRDFSGEKERKGTWGRGRCLCKGPEAGTPEKLKRLCRLRLKRRAGL